MTLSDIAQEWMERLGKFDLQSIKKALDHCQEREEHPPSLPKFFSLCESYRQDEYVQALPHKLTPEEVERNRKRIEEAASAIGMKLDKKAWARRIIANPKNYPDISLKYAREALVLPDVEIAA